MAILIYTLDSILFFIIALSVGYLFVFAFISLFGGRKKYPYSTRENRFVILIPAYKEDNVIIDSVRSLLSQEYPAKNMEIVVISDKMKEETNKMLLALPINLIQINPENSSKAYALKTAVEHLQGNEYDIAVILDADNVVESNFLSCVNDAFNSGVMALQAHRTAKNLNNDMAILDAISEEINNSIFRKGHVKIGLSSALIGSGMAFKFSWFKKSVIKLTTAGEDKELELLLFKDNIYVEYLDYLMVYDEKIQGERGFYNQRRRWISAQFGSLFFGLKYLPKAISSFNFGYIERIFVWMLLPKIILLGIIVIYASITLIVDWSISVKWLILLVLLLITFAMAVPVFLVTKKSIKTIKRLPLLFLLMVLNLFRTRGANKKFIHTQKGLE